MLSRAITKYVLRIRSAWFIFVGSTVFCLAGCVVDETVEEDEGDRPTAGAQAGGGDVTSLDIDMNPISCDDLDLGACEFERDPETCECVYPDPPSCDEPELEECEFGYDLVTCDCLPTTCDCPAIDNPVCGADGETYSSPCDAECVGVEVSYRGPCSSAELCFEDDVEPNCESLCSTFEVCINDYCESAVEISSECFNACRGEREDFLAQIWPNLCEGSGSCNDFIERGIRLFGEGVCEDAGGECVEPEPDVMYVTDDPEECERIDFECPQNSAYHYDNCGCGCYIRDCDQECEGVTGERVCSPDGQTFPSECHASCSGVYEYRSCDEACVCPNVYEPECGLDGVTYNNSCIRECQGVPLLNEGECYREDSICSALDFEQEPSCDQICGEVSACFADRCSPDELMRVNESCQELCSIFDPLFFCDFGECAGLGFFFADFDDQRIECLELRCPDEGRGAEYVSYDALNCSLIGEIDCGSGESFNNECGCGCINTQCPSEDQARYVSREPEVCAQVTLSCPEGSALFNDECGCGCSF